MIYPVFLRTFPSCFKLRRLARAAFASSWILFVTFTATAAEWSDLLDKPLSQWDTYLSYRHVVGFNGQQPLDAAGNKIEPIGYSKDPTGVFTVSEERGKLVLRISGEVYGCVFTKQEFSNYHLKLKMKWGTAKFPPRLDKLRDTGILYHSVGPAGVDYWRAWMLSQEFQIMEGHMGDYWSIGSSGIDIRAYLPEGSMNAVASQTQPFLPFGPKPSVGGFCLRSGFYESAPGEWTDLELICFEGKSLHIVNGHVVMVLQNSRSETNGVTTPLTKGKIQLQCEASEVFFSDIKIQPIGSLPAEYAALFK